MPDTAIQVKPLLDVRDLAKDFDVSRPWLNRVLEGQPRLILKAVDGVSFTINRGETLSLVGESGCGKSTVARVICGLYPPSRGSVNFDGVDLATITDRNTMLAMRRRFQMIFQDPFASLNPRWRVGRIIAEPIRSHDLLKDDDAIKARVGELLLQVGLSPLDMTKYPHEFSGGQRQRISIARALSSNPEFLICDEPTSALDVSVQAQILNLMKDLQRAHGLTYLFISHNLAVVSHISNRVGVMYLGRIVEIAETKTLFNRPLHPYTQMLQSAIPDIKMSGKSRTPVAGEVPNPLNPPTGCAFHPRCPFANERCKVERPELKDYSGTLAACHGVEEGRIPVAK
ncbi:Vitamin B12 import ATP-binding protein BtuD [Usitatibacter rugosus]|uniref:Vitamin B12 import ATP-binding protein BtuD n=1 Tax=Usitatibacter rugosus TaxID=2732067 RepID=A0A6M4GYQ8_9PROT|nr:oligopeptide/dipeptide ABC transporter ATP-binding protein [Usitatibacter rugosus]QJR12399.1 Vitamin B12 import ATP-binding protein BtuD [Usitatibacter rugosus]